MQEEYAIRRYEQAAALLPMRWQRLARQLPDWQKARAEELRGQYRRCIEELTAAQLEVERLIETLEPREREIFRLRYIDGAKWEDICVIMSYSWRQVHRAHSAALQKLEEAEKEAGEK